MRLFIAINFPDEIKSAIAEIRDNIKESAMRGNFSFDENLHLTLVFLGECDQRQTEAVKAVMNNTRFPEFTLVFEKTGYFKRDGGDTWWVGLKENKTLSGLQSDLTGALIQKGFVLEKRKYTPHVTIGREVRMHAGFVLPKTSHDSFVVKNIELMKSERVNGRLVYSRVYLREGGEV
jgi:2'-5' RNA ligase